MKLTTKGRNAVCAMLDICVYAQSKPVSLSSISDRQGISVNYLEQLFIKLRKAELVKSIRGPGGGYVLGNDPKLINIAQIINAVEDSLETTLCEGLGNCHDGETCISHNLWINLKLILNGFLSSTSVYDAVNQPQLIEQYLDSFPTKGKIIKKSIMQIQGEKPCQ